MRSWRGMTWLWCTLAVGCGGALQEESLPEEPARESPTEELSAQWKRPLPELGPAYLLRDTLPPAVDPFPGPFGSPYPTNLVDFRGTLLFAANNFETGEAALWRSDGTTPGTVLLRVFPPIPMGLFAGNSVTPLGVAGGLFFFTAGDEAHGIEPWVTDGTPEGTRLVEDLTPGPDSSRLGVSLARGDILYFVRDNLAFAGAELWRTDGTEEGTVLVSDLGPVEQVPSLVALDEDTFIMNAEDAAHGNELWVSDGTDEGTRLLADIYPGGTSSNPFHLTPANGLVYFTAEHPDYGTELWRTDGTEEGTELVEDTRPGPEGSGVRPLTVFKRHLYFMVDEPETGGLELRALKARRSCSRSKRVASIPNPYTSATREVYAFVSTFTTTERKLFFTVYFDIGSPAPRDVQLWRTDGSRRGTKLLYQPLLVSPDLSVPELVPTGDGRVLFYAYDEEHGHEPWVTNGMRSGTRLLQDIRPGPGSSYPQELMRAGDFAYFVADDGVHGREVWALPLPTW